MPKIPCPPPSAAPRRLAAACAIAAAIAAAISTATITAIMAGPAGAQDYVYPTVPTRPGHVPGVGPSNPSSSQSSNISPYDTHSTIAPRLPTPAAGEDAAPRRFLLAARQALAAGRTGEAQEALERAETRLLDRSTPAFATNEPSRRPLVGAIRGALQALSAGDRGRALAIIDGALAQTGQGRPPPGRTGYGAAAGRPPGVSPGPYQAPYPPSAAPYPGYPARPAYPYPYAAPPPYPSY